MQKTEIRREIEPVKPSERLSKLVVCLLAPLALAACIEDEESETRFACPSLSDNVTWRSFGRFVFEQSGNDSTAREIAASCGWHVHGGHNGGIGDTLQVASPTESVVLVWAFNDFHAYRVTSGWTGSTERGVRIGSHITDLYRAHPMFVASTDGRIHQLSEGPGVRVMVTSDVNGFVESILVGRYYRR